jgi:hypothetical protein
MPYWVGALLLFAVVAALLFAFAIPIAIWVLPIVGVALVAVGIIRGAQARQSPGEERRS